MGLRPWQFAAVQVQLEALDLHGRQLDWMTSRTQTLETAGLAGLKSYHQSYLLWAVHLVGEQETDRSGSAVRGQVLIQTVVVWQVRMC